MVWDPATVPSGDGAVGWVSAWRLTASSGPKGLRNPYILRSHAEDRKGA